MEGNEESVSLSDDDDATAPRAKSTPKHHSTFQTEEDEFNLNSFETDRPKTNQINSPQMVIVERDVQDDDSELERMIAEEEGEDGFITIAKLSKGSAFGELALIEMKPRMADIRCTKNCHLMTLNKENFNNVIGAKEKRIYQEKINFLKNVPIFSLVTRTFLGKLTYFFQVKNMIKGAVLYFEG